MTWRGRGGSLLALVALVALVVLVAAGVVVWVAGEGEDSHRFVVATPEPAAVARVAPYSEAAAGGSSYTSGDPIRVTCRVAGPRDDRYWYRLEDGTFLPEDEIYAESWAVSAVPPCQ